MNEQQFKEALQELHDKNQRAQYTRDELKDIQYQFSYILQSYLWEGNAIKTLNNARYWSLAKSWHPDKFTEGSQQNAFVAWYMQIQKDQNSLFKVLSQTKEAYRPELRYRIKQANDETFYFFGAFARHLPLIYNIFWPVFYVLEALERNIDNYSPKIREGVKDFYIGSFVIPFLTLSVLMEDKNSDRFIDFIFSQNPWIGLIIRNGVIGVFVSLLSTYAGILFSESFKKLDKNFDILSILFYQIPMTPVFQTFNEFKNNINNAASLKTKIFSLIKCAFASVFAIGLSTINAMGLFYALPFLGALGLFPLFGLMLANIPILTSQFYNQPKNSLLLVGEYLFTIVNRYQNLAKIGINYFYDLIKPYFSKVYTTLAHKEPEKELVATVDEPVSRPYWKEKFDKYMSKDNIDRKRIKLKKLRNEILNKMGIKEEHPFRDTLDDLINQKSAHYDSSGFVKDDASDKQFPILETLNLKTQVLFLNNALQKRSYLPQGQFINHYPKDLDYHKLIAKNMLG